MGKTRAGAMIVERRRSAGLGAGGGPPARGVARRFAHFRATQFRFGVRAVAVAAAGRNGAGGARCVCAKNDCGSENERREKDEPHERATKRGPEREGRDHARECARVPKKNHWPSGIGRFRTEVLGRGRDSRAEALRRRKRGEGSNAEDAGIHRNHRGTGVGKAMRMNSRKRLDGFRFETWGQDWFGLMKQGISIRVFFAMRYAQYDGLWKLAWSLH